MTTEEIIGAAVGASLSTLRAWLGGEGLTVSEDLIRDVQAQVTALLRGALVVHAERIVVDDQR